MQHKDESKPFSYAHALLFTGHMIDRPDRPIPRFPASAEPRVRAAIREAVASLAGDKPHVTIGLAAAASGGDLLFHEVCDELGLATRVLLALPQAEFLEASVAPAGSAWVRRFDELLQRRGDANVLFMSSGDGLLEGQTGNIWQRANLWMIEQAVELAPERTLLALWDGKTGDGHGGTEHFVLVAPRFGVQVAAPIPMQSLLA